jgi:hypothetical protein
MASRKLQSFLAAPEATVASLEDIPLAKAADPHKFCYP